jgi:hypothetical protein
MEATRPAWWASRAVGLVVLAVPVGERRERYRQEFRAELHGMSRIAQLCHAAGLLGQAVAYQRCTRCDRDLFIAPYPGGGAVSGPGPSFGG